MRLKLFKRIALLGFVSILLLVAMFRTAFMVSVETNPDISGVDAKAINCMSRLGKAVFYLVSQYNSTLKLCRESPNVSPNVYWLVSDNLWAHKALEGYYANISSAIKAKLQELVVIYSLPRNAEGLPISYKHEAVIGDIVPVPFNETVSYTLYSNTYILKTDIANSTMVMDNWQGYADLLLYASLSFHYDDDETKAIELFQNATDMWDGIGLQDEYVKAHGKYQTYKLALLLYTSKALGIELTFEAKLVDRIWSQQDAITGGIITDYLPDGTPDGDTNTETTSMVVIASPAQVIRVPQDCPTIQEAINAANSGDTINVSSGTYYEYVVVNKSISLVGEDKDATIIDGNYSGTVVRLTSDNVTITRFTIRNHGKEWYDSCIHVESNGCNVTGNKITTNATEDFHPLQGSLDMGPMVIPPPSTFGILLRSSCNNHVSNNNVTDHLNVTSSTDLESHGIGLIFDSNNNSILNNNVFNSEIGIFLEYRSNNNEVSNNNVTYNYICGIGSYLDCDNNLFSNNYVANNKRGMDIYGTRGNKVFNNIITNNEEGIWLEYYGGHLLIGNNIIYNKVGITIRQTSNNTIYHNNFINNTKQVSFFELYSNTWDAGYPSGGNYWSDHEVVDFYSGPYQNETGSDGIIDNPYVIDENNRDRYPIVPEFPPAMVLPLLLVVTLVAVILAKKRTQVS